MKTLKAWLLAALFASGSALANVDIFNAATKQALQAVNGSLMSGKPAAAPSSSAGAYQPNAAVSQQVREDVIARLQALAQANGGDAQSMQTLANGLRQVDVPAAIWQELQKMGFQRDDVVIATAFWLVVNWEILQGRENTPAESRAVAEQLAAHYAQSGVLSTMSNEDKQYGAEAMIWIASLQQMLYLDASVARNDAAINAARNDARAALKSLGFDPDVLRLTNQGFVAK